MPEIVQTLARRRRASDVALRFVPVSAPLSRGIFATCFARARRRRSTPSELARAATTRPTRGEPFVRVPEEAAARGRRGRRLELRRGRLRASAPVARRQAHASRCFARDRQPDQGRRRPGDPEHEPHARPRREASARGRRALAVSATSSSSSAARSSARRRSCRRSPATCARSSTAARRVAIVHGGGPQATELQKRLGLETTQVGGRRVTDARDARRHEDGRRRQAQRRPVRGAARRRASPPVGLHGAAALVVRAAKRPPRVYAGARPRAGRPRPRRRRHRLQPARCSSACWAAGYVPVIACLGADADGGVYNINADIVANQLAAALHGRRAVPRDRRRPACCATSTIRRRASPRLTVAEARAGDRRRRRHRRHDPQARGGVRRPRQRRRRDPHRRQGPLPGSRARSRRSWVGWYNPRSIIIPMRYAISAGVLGIRSHNLSHGRPARRPVGEGPPPSPM